MFRDDVQLTLYPSPDTDLMRFPSLPTFLRTFYAFSNTTLRSAPATFNTSAARPVYALRASMPTIPFLGALFSTAETRNMTHPVTKSDGEWQAQLSPRKCLGVSTGTSAVAH